MPWSIGAVTFPYGPADISDDCDCQTDSLQLDGDEAVIFATAPGVRVVVWSGTICDPSYPTKRALEGQYCSILRGYQGSSRAVVNPSGTYTGSWYIKKVSIAEQAEGELAKVSYTIIMWLGSDLEVL